MFGNLSTPSSSMTATFADVDEKLVLLFFILGGILTLTGTLLNLCPCLLFCRTKFLDRTPYGIFIIALSVADVIKLMAEYVVHVLYIYIDNRYFVCSITWFATLSSENLSYLFLCALGIERNLKVWMADRRLLITRQRACRITTFLILFIIIYDHPFLGLPYDVSYRFVKLFNHSILFSCDNAFYQSYGYTYSIADLIFIESVGLNNLILPIMIILTNILLIIGLRRRTCKRQHLLGRRGSKTWREQSVILYVFIASMAFIVLTTPIGLLNAYSAIHNHKMATNNVALVLDLLEILHHCSHFPILLMTSSIIRRETFQILFPGCRRRRTFSTSRTSTEARIRSKSSSF